MRESGSCLQWRVIIITGWGSGNGDIGLMGHDNCIAACGWGRLAESSNKGAEWMGYKDGKMVEIKELESKMGIDRDYVLGRRGGEERNTLKDSPVNLFFFFFASGKIIK